MKLRSYFYRLQNHFRRSAPLIEVGISRANLLHNLHAYQRAYPRLAFAPVLKSNAYGHGLVPVARILEGEDIPFFVVDSLYEARTLRGADITTPILVIGYTRAEDIARNHLRNTTFTIVGIEQLRELVRCAHRPVAMHLKIDTGMHRQGVVPEDIPEAIRLIERNTNVRLTGICTHLADAEIKNSPLTVHQQKMWRDASSALMQAFPTTTMRHIAATKGVPFATDEASVVRLGIGLYGLDASPDQPVDSMPVLELRTIVSSVRELPQGESVGYNATCVTERLSRIATIPAGYFEGIDRRLSNIGKVGIGTEYAPIAGRVSMNITSLDVTDLPEVRAGDRAIVISRDPTAPNSVQNIAAITNQISYEVVAGIPTHLKRVVE